MLLWYTDDVRYRPKRSYIQNTQKWLCSTDTLGDALNNYSSNK